MYERIMVPLDGSDLAELALPCAEELARALNSEVVLLGICEPDECEHVHMHQLYIKKVAEMVANHIREAVPTATVRPVAICGRPAEEIIDYADKNDISLVIMVSHGRSGMKPWAMGNVADKVLQRIGIPILLIRAKTPHLEADARGLFNRILIPLDSSDAGEAAVPYVKQLTERLESEVILLEVVAPGKHVHTVGGLDYVRFTEQRVESIKAGAKEYLEKVRKRLAGTKGIIKCEVRTGDDAASEIIKFADEENIRLIAMSTHGHSCIKEWFFGSVTHKIMRTSNRPILLVRA